MGKLTAVAVKSLGPGRHHDGNCLLLEVRPTGSRSWLARVRHNGKRRDIGLGSASVITLARARERCREVRLAIAEGRDPLTIWQPAPPMARFFNEVGKEFVEQTLKGKTQQQALSRLERYAFPQLGKLQIQSIDAVVISDALRPIWRSKPETALRTRDLILRTLRYARPDGALLMTTLARAISDRLGPQPDNKNFEATRRVIALLLDDTRNDLTAILTPFAVDPFSTLAFGEGFGAVDDLGSGPIKSLALEAIG
ncbi:MAG: Arm DNA-binding domain-containing protein [Erythrobacter sp.]|nr:Arm DNA-binding domain-containing protein [Erythrobacter sp.]